MGRRFGLADVVKYRVDKGGGDGKVAGVEVLPSEARCSHTSDGVVVLCEVIVVAGKEKTNYFGLWASQSGVGKRAAGGHG